MATMQTVGYCPTCEQQRPFTKQKPNHVLHLILTLVTFGIWGLVWIAVAIGSGSKPARCTFCGGGDRTRDPSKQVQWGKQHPATSDVARLEEEAS